MWKNVGKIDKLLRYVMTVVFAYIGYSYHWVFYLIAMISAFTAASSFCGVYKLLGINTYKPENKKHKR